MQIQLLAREGGPKAKIAERFGVIRQGVQPRESEAWSAVSEATAAAASKLDAFREYIQARLGRFDLPATVLFHEIE
jgi:hypothetical protein